MSHRPSTVGAVNRPPEIRPGFAVVDVETTGFIPDEERIIEVGVVVLDGKGREVSSFSTLVDPGRDPGPTHIHGITASMVAGAPTFARIRPYLSGLLSGRVVVGHNVDRFDLAFLRAECRRSGGDSAVPGMVATVDTLQVAQDHLGMRGRAALADCCAHYGLSWADHHSALGDARVTAALFGAMRARLGDTVLGLDRMLSGSVHSRWPGGSDVPPLHRVRAEALVGSPATG
jgi:DNA polymerase III epsilon subunit family exonuclease